MSDVACFCGCQYSFEGQEGPCPKCGAVAGVRTTVIRPPAFDQEPYLPVEIAAAPALVR